MGDHHDRGAGHHPGHGRGVVHRCGGQPAGVVRVLERPGCPVRVLVRLLILAALAAALVRFAAAAERLLRELARGAVLMEPAILVIPGGTAWPDWEPEQPPCHGVRQAQVGRGPAGRARHEHAGKHGRLPGDPGTEAMQHRDQPGQRKPPARSDGRGENAQEQPDVPS
jgi:hypothetical protein